MKTLLRLLLLGATALSIPAAYGQYSTPVREVDRPEKRAMQFTVICTSVSACTAHPTLTIPAGTYLVLEYASGYISLPSGSSGARVLQLSFSGINHYVPSATVLTGGDNILGQPVKIYLDVVPVFSVWGGPVNSGTEITFSGYYASK